MARGTQLQTLVSMLKAEAGHSTLVSVGIDNLESLKQIIRRTQETLYDDYDWPHLRVKPYKTLAAGSRYYDLPISPALNYERIEDVAVWYSTSPVPITRGIGFEQYAQYSSDDDERADPVMRWDVVWTGTAEQIEVHPIPATNDQSLQFIGIRRLRALTAESDVADLDDQLIVLHAAAEILAGQGSKKARVIIEAAVRRMERLRARTKGASPITQLGLGDAPRHRGTVINVVSRAP